MNEIIQEKSNSTDLELLNSFLLPSTSFSNGSFNMFSQKIYYISDIHLLHHIDDNKNIECAIRKIVKELFSSELINDILKKKKILIFITGDLTERIDIAKCFYHEFRVRYEYVYYKYWKKYNVNEFNNKEYSEKELKKKLLAYKKSKIKQLEKLKLALSKWINYDKTKEKGGNILELIIKKIDKNKYPPYTKNLAEKINYLDWEIKELNKKDSYIKTDFMNKFHRERFEHIKQIPCIVTLGNHELWEFASLEEATEKYKKLLDEEKMVLLQNDVMHFKDFDILGGVGFSKYNKDYNYVTFNFRKENAIPMTDEQIDNESEKFLNIYKDEVKRCKEKLIPLIVLTHYPISGWSKGKLTENICYYFNGHTHRNTETEHTELVNIFSDNQIGYTKKHFELKSAILGCCYNPFVDYEEGYHEITLEQYKSFVFYSGESIEGTYHIEKQINQFRAKFYMIKKMGFYGFFLVNPKKGTKICSGGKIKRINEINDIKYFYDNFDKILLKYIKILGPYRKLEEQISNEIKKLGFSGKIHGSIVDIDFLNHILVNFQEQKLEFYYSPTFGIAKSFPTLEQLLLCEENKLLLKSVDNALLDNLKKESNIILGNRTDMEKSLDSYQKIDIKNSFYSYSNELYKLQRIFTANTLRDWNDEWISGKKLIK